MMVKSVTNKFTPAPWRVGDKYQTDIYAARAGHAIARTVNPQHEGECEANARLIAAAPDLLAAATVALALIKDHWIEEHGQRQVGDAWGALESAIAKAGGAT